MHALGELRDRSATERVFTKEKFELLMKRKDSEGARTYKEDHLLMIRKMVGSKKGYCGAEHKWRKSGKVIVIAFWD